MPNLFAEFILAALRFAAIWMVFYMLHRPRTRIRRIMAVGIMVLQYPLGRISFFASGGFWIVKIVVDTVLLLTLAYICEGERSHEDEAASRRELARPLISAVYFNGMDKLLNYVMSCYLYAFNGSIPPSFSLWSYILKSLEAILFFLWTWFYYRTARNMTAKAPVSFWLLTLLTPLATLAVITSSNGAIPSVLASSKHLFLYPGIFGTLIIVLNMCIFGLYVKLSVTNEALRFAQNINHTPPVWSPEQGLSNAFIEKYEITPREREVIEIMLDGKTDKEIAIALNIAVNTVQAHLKRIYRKTGASGRFALSALISGG